MADAQDILTAARKQLAAGRFEEATATVEAGLAAHPEDEELQELSRSIRVALGILKASEASRLRREELSDLPLEERDGHPDSEGTLEAFDEAIDLLQGVLDDDPAHAKAHIMLAGALFAKDREGEAERAIGVLKDALEHLPGNEDLTTALSRLQTTCEHCDDTGLCRTCFGGGNLPSRLLARACPDCYGKGTCSHCGIL